MSTNHIAYIDSFKKYEPSALTINTVFQNLSNYSTFINNKANEIFSIASFDTTIDRSLLQREITELGINYIKIFVAMNKAK